MPPTDNRRRPSQAIAARDAARPPAGLSPDKIRDRQEGETRRQHFADLIATNLDGIGLSLPRSMDKDRFGRLLLTAANTNPDLFECDTRSFIAAGVACAQLGLEPNDARGLAYLIPFAHKVTLVIGYKGMLDLARRSGLVSAVQTHAVLSGDVFEYEAGLEPKLRHVPNLSIDRDRWEDVQFFYATARIHVGAKAERGEPQYALLSRAQVEKRRDSNPGSKSRYSPWQSGWAVEMGQKTALRALCKLLPQTVELADADRLDERPLFIGDLGNGEASAMPDSNPDVLEANASDQPALEEAPIADQLDPRLIPADAEEASK